MFLCTNSYIAIFSGCLACLDHIQVAPFGGFKQSGLGREGSKYGLDEYLEVSTNISQLHISEQECDYWLLNVLQIKYVCMGNMG